jgi:uncharacterized C2H2 Zn-finger protein
MSDSESNSNSNEKIESCPYCGISFADKKRWNNSHNIKMHINKHPQASLKKNNTLLTNFFTNSTTPVLNGN